MSLQLKSRNWGEIRHLSAACPDLSVTTKQSLIAKSNEGHRRHRNAVQMRLESQFVTSCCDARIFSERQRSVSER